MKLRAVKFDDNEDPESATVDLSLDELALLYALVGNVTTRDITEEFGHRWGDVLNEVASGIAGGFFNRFYLDGWHDVMPKSHGVSVKVTHE